MASIKSKVKSAVSKVKSTVKKAVSTVASAASKSNQSASVSSSSSKSKITIPKLPDGPQSKVPTGPVTQSYVGVTPATQKKLEQTKGSALNMSIAPTESNSIKTTKRKSGGSKSGGDASMFDSLATGDPRAYLGTSRMSASSSSSPSSSKSSSAGSSGAASSVRGSSGGVGGGTIGDRRSREDSADDTEMKRIQEEVLRLEQQDMSVAQDAVTSDAPIVREEQDAMKETTAASIMSPNNDALDLLDDEIRETKRQLRDDMREINADYDETVRDTQGIQQSETGQTSVAIANAGGYLGFSGSGQGVMLSLAENHRAELADIETRRQKAINDAKRAQRERRYDLVRLKAAEIARLDDEAYERTETYNARVRAETEKQNEKAEQLATEKSIFNAVKAGAKSAQDIFEALNGRVSMKDINSYLSGITKSASGVGSGFKISSSNTAALMGTGMSGDDVAALNEYVNEYGYDDTVRNSLTPAQRVAADKIFKVAGGTGGDLGKPMNVLDLDRIEKSYGVRFPLGVTSGEVTQFLNDNWGATPEDMQNALDLIFGAGDGGGTASTIDFSESYLKENLNTSQLKKLADKTGASSFWTSKSFDIARMFENADYMRNLNNLVQQAREDGYADDEILEFLTS